MSYKQCNQYKYHISIARDAGRIWRENDNLKKWEIKFFYLLMITSQGQADLIKKIFNDV